MSANEASLDNRINEATVTQSPGPRILSSPEDSELPTRLVREIAQSSDVSIVFSLVDVCGQQCLFFSTDDAPLVSHTLAPQKTWIAAAPKMPAHELATSVQPGGDSYDLEKEEDIRCLGGGFPRWSDGRLLGGIGISGGSAEEDMLIARQAMMQLNALHYPLTIIR